ncbi:MAG: HAMP domain-containing sensor histidine kinase [Acidimicrobiia bacterium]
MTALIAVLAVINRDRALLAWIVLGLAVGVMLVVEVLLDRTDIELMTVLIAIGVAVASPFGRLDAVTAVVAAAVMFALPLYTIVEPSRRALLAAIVTFTAHTVTLVVASGGWAGLATAAILMPGAFATWLLIHHIVGRLRTEHASYRQLFDRVPVGLYRTGLAGELLDVNPALADLVGIPREQLVGRLAQDFFFDREDLTRLRETIGDRTDALTTDIRFRRSDGETIWVRDHTRSVTDEQGRIICFEGELQDVTDQRRHLEELETLVKSKSELIGAVSHELRTPLTAVIGFLDLLRSGDAADEKSELLNLATEQARDIAGIVEDLLTAARLDNQELVVRSEVFDVRSAVDIAVTSVAGRSPSGVVVDVPSDLMVLADAARVRQVVRNLVGNAIRYGAPPIVMRAESHEGSVRIVVADQGVEIPDRTVARMFDAFFSGGESSARQPGSIGLGLAVSQRLARLMGGELSYARVGDETQFVLELPSASVAALAETA